MSNNTIIKINDLFIFDNGSIIKVEDMAVNDLPDGMEIWVIFIWLTKSNKQTALLKNDFMKLIENSTHYREVK